MVVDTLLPASRAVINTTQQLAVISGLTGGANETYVVSAVSDAGEATVASRCQYHRARRRLGV